MDIEVLTPDCSWGLKLVSQMLILLLECGVKPSLHSMLALKGKMNLLHTLY